MYIIEEIKIIQPQQLYNIMDVVITIEQINGESFPPFPTGIDLKHLNDIFLLDHSRDGRTNNSRKPKPGFEHGHSV